jgi:hypothetical protein
MSIQSIRSAKAEFFQKLTDLEVSQNALDPSNLDLYLARSVELGDQIEGVEKAIKALESLEIEVMQQEQIDSESQKIEAERLRQQSIEAELENQIKALI